MRKYNGYASVLVLIFIFIITLSISFLVFILDSNNLIIKNSKDIEQSKYISESYLNLIITDCDNYINKINDYNRFNVDLFPDLKKDVFYKIEEIQISYKDLTKNKSTQNFKIPFYKVSVLSDYNGIEYKTSAMFSKYNLIFFNEFGTINYRRFENSENIKEDKNSIFLDKFKQDILFNKPFKDQNNILKYIDLEETEVNNINENSLNGLDNISNNYIIDEMVKLKILPEKGNVYINENTNLISSSKKEFFGVLFLDNCEITLYDDIKFKGILVSNSSYINLNGHKLRVEGKFIELSDDGSIAGTEINNDPMLYNKLINNIDAAIDYRVIFIKRNDM